jgi:hypothetical protein
LLAIRVLSPLIDSKSENGCEFDARSDSENFQRRFRLL